MDSITQIMNSNEIQDAEILEEIKDFDNWAMYCKENIDVFVPQLEPKIDLQPNPKLKINRDSYVFEILTKIQGFEPIKSNSFKLGENEYRISGEAVKDRNGKVWMVVEPIKIITKGDRRLWLAETFAKAWVDLAMVAEKEAIQKKAPISEEQLAEHGIEDESKELSIEEKELAKELAIDIINNPDKYRVDISMKEIQKVAKLNMRKKYVLSEEASMEKTLSEKENEANNLQKLYKATVGEVENVREQLKTKSAEGRNIEQEINNILKHQISNL